MSAATRPRVLCEDDPSAPTPGPGDVVISRPADLEWFRALQSEVSGWIEEQRQRLQQPGGGGGADPSDGGGARSRSCSSPKATASGGASCTRGCRSEFAAELVATSRPEDQAGADEWNKVLRLTYVGAGTRGRGVWARAEVQRVVELVDSVFDQSERASERGSEGGGVAPITQAQRPAPPPFLLQASSSAASLTPIMAARVPVVGHNALLDFIHTTSKFVGEPPPNVTQWPRSSRRPSQWSTTPRCCAGPGADGPVRRRLQPRPGARGRGASGAAVAALELPHPRPPLPRPLLLRGAQAGTGGRGAGWRSRGRFEAAAARHARSSGGPQRRPGPIHPAAPPPPPGVLGGAPGARRPVPSASSSPSTSRLCWTCASQRALASTRTPPPLRSSCSRARQHRHGRGQGSGPICGRGGRCDSCRGCWGAAHDAGADAFMTGVAFLRMAALLAADVKGAATAQAPAGRRRCRLRPQGREAAR